MFQYALDMNWDLPNHTPLMASVFEDLVSDLNYTLLLQLFFI